VIDAASAHRERLVRDGAVRLADGEYPRLAMIDAEGRASREG
jgi:hypothetical protein